MLPLTCTSALWCRRLPLIEHQHLVRAQAAQRRRAHGVGAVGDRRPREVERRRQRLDDLRRLGVAARRDLLGRDDVDRHRLLGGAPAARDPTVTCLGEAGCKRDVDGERRPALTTRQSTRETARARPLSVNRGPPTAGRVACSCTVRSRRSSRSRQPRRPTPRRSDNGQTSARVVTRPVTVSGSWAVAIPLVAQNRSTHIEVLGGRHGTVRFLPGHLSGAREGCRPRRCRPHRWNHPFCGTSVTAGPVGPRSLRWRVGDRHRAAASPRSQTNVARKIAGCVRCSGRVADAMECSGRIWRSCRRPGTRRGGSSLTSTRILRPLIDVAEQPGMDAHVPTRPRRKDRPHWIACTFRVGGCPHLRQSDDPHGHALAARPSRSGGGSERGD